MPTDREKESIFTDDEGVQPYSLEDIPPEREVVTTPYDAPVRTLIQEIQEKTLIVNPLFQRRSVWDQTLKSRLIESLLLNIPIPVLFFAENDDGTRVVVDGQQRLRAIDEFHSGAFKLKNLQILPSLNGKRWADLTSRQSRLIQNRTLRCVVISPKSDPNLRFEMFERLNTLGISLTDQELRNCVYRGDLNNLLEELATDKAFLSFLGKKEPDNRLRHHELILRFFALREKIQGYKPPLKSVLNEFMSLHRKMGESQIEQFRASYKDAWTKVALVFDDMAFRRVRVSKREEMKWDKSINRSVYDIQMFSLMDISERELKDNSKKIIEAFVSLCLKNASFQDAVSYSTADRTKFYTRLALWGKEMSKMGFNIPYLKDIPNDINV